MKIEMFDDHFNALANIRAIKNASDTQVLDLLRAVLGITDQNTPIGNIVLDACQSVEIETDNDARLCIEAEQEMYARSRERAQDQHNEAISRGA